MRSFKQTTTGKILETKDYGIFSVAQENRGIIPSHVRKIAKSMREQGWIDAFPMMVKPNGKSMVIMDGQNRFKAAQSLDVPVKYVVADEAHRDIPISNLNQNQKNWVIADYIKSYMHSGNKHYEVLDWFCREYSIKPTAAAIFLSKDPGANERVTSGKFKVDDAEWAATKIQAMKRIKEKIQWNIEKKTFYRALLKCCLIEDFDIWRLVRQAEKHPGRFIDYGNQRDMIRMIDDAYNFRNRHPIPLAYLVENYDRNAK